MCNRWHALSAYDETGFERLERRRGKSRFRRRLTGPFIDDLL